MLWPLSESGFRWKGSLRLSSFGVMVMLLLGQPEAVGPVCVGDLLKTVFQAYILVVRSAPFPSARKVVCAMHRKCRYLVCSRGEAGEEDAFGAVRVRSWSSAFWGPVFQDWILSHLLV